MIGASPAPTAAPFPMSSHVDVMVVGEPSLMGGDYGEEDERMISRLENTQFDPAQPMPLPTHSLPMPLPIHHDQGRGFSPHSSLLPLIF